MSINYNRVNSEFETILLGLSKNRKTTHRDAVAQAEEYTNSLCQKKKYSKNEKEEIFEYCLAMIADWYPDTSIFQRLSG
jgi:hypothetical protein